MPSHAGHFTAEDDDDTHSVVSDVSDLEGDGSHLLATLRKHNVPVSKRTVRLSTHGKEGSKSQEQFRKDVLDSLIELIPDRWSYFSSPSDLKIDRVSGAMTNCVYFVTGPAQRAEDGSDVKPPKVLLRVYGTAAGSFISRDKEMFWLCKMSDIGVAPKLLGVFANGRFEQFLESSTLTKEEMRDPQTSIQIAQQLYKLHQLINSCTPDDLTQVEGDPEHIPTEPKSPSTPNPQTSELWAKLRRWQKLAAKTAIDLKRDQPERYRLIRDVVDIRQLKDEIALLEERLAKVNSPLVFAHNDAQYGNILRKHKDNSIIIVDYEYAGINYRGYDIANHFCEWAADYHCATPHKMNFSNYPTREQQTLFLNAYLDAADEGFTEGATETASRNAQVEALMNEVDHYALASNLLWGLWGLMQAAETEIDFDYVGYACERFRQYAACREHLFVDE
ncbi:kinase-like domain-containing protein [Fimicolochytrium jonesii]|uniref:kinase-like domain-containing protein n=1 Tax=Fimicolochytrium jonesii TaxID=1396493 RepID=UPI0022FE0DD9|nr:kinase-like domain-containing protein [Fimicolochytrium jonesii]KAI8821355.1 kinase-like domain-containing protein [Fimicolochytrium jonesii]